VAQVDEPPRERSQAIARWELELISKIAKRFRTSEGDDLKAELARKLLVLKNTPSSHIRNWHAYVAKFLFNKAANWVRDERARQLRHGPIEATAETGESMHLFPKSEFGLPGQNEDVSIAFAQLWRALDPELRRFWQVLAEENGNQVQAARRVGKHRNTARHYMQRIRAIARRHGFIAPS
jgi:DNA-directed RNA polymerase specialized sigma24 family protein